MAEGPGRSLGGSHDCHPGDLKWPIFIWTEIISGVLCSRVSRRGCRQHPGHLCCRSLLKNAHGKPTSAFPRYFYALSVVGNKHLHPPPCDGWRVLPCWDSLPNRHHVHAGVAVWHHHVQDLLHHHLHQPDHQLPLPHGALRRQIHRRLPPHQLPQVSDRHDLQGEPRSKSTGLLLNRFFF